jgi:hypothetical protein
MIEQLAWKILEIGLLFRRGQARSSTEVRDLKLTKVGTPHKEPKKLLVLQQKQNKFAPNRAEKYYDTNEIYV